MVVRRFFTARTLGEIAHPAFLCLLHSFGLPLVFASIVLAGFVEMAIIGRWMTEYEREWRSRMAAYLLLGATAWLLTAAAVYLVPWGVERLSGHVDQKSWAGALQAVLAAAWAAISGGGTWMASRTPTNGSRHQPTLLARIVMAIAPAVFLLGMFAGVSMLGEKAVGWSGTYTLAKSDLDAKQALPFAVSSAVGSMAIPTTPATYSTAAVVFVHGTQSFDSPGTKTGDSTVLFLATQQPRAGWWLMVAGLLMAAVFGALINVNHFSLHMLYANRLMRCYIGASCRKRGVGSLGAPTGVHEPRARRQANDFTGFDPWDDLPLAELGTVRDPAELHGAGRSSARGPCARLPHTPVRCP